MSKQLAISAAFCAFAMAALALSVTPSQFGSAQAKGATSQLVAPLQVLAPFSR